MGQYLHHSDKYWVHDSTSSTFFEANDIFLTPFMYQSLLEDAINVSMVEKKLEQNTNLLFVSKKAADFLASNPDTMEKPLLVTSAPPAGDFDRCATAAFYCLKCARMLLRISVGESPQLPISVSSWILFSSNSTDCRQCAEHQKDPGKTSFASCSKLLANS